MQIQGIGSDALLNGKRIERIFPFEMSFEGALIYEVIRIIDGYPLFWKEHLERMRNSLDLIGQPGEVIVDEIEGTIRAYIRQGIFKDNNIKVVVGNFAKGTFEYIAYFIPSYYPDDIFYRRGARVVTLDHERSNPNAKVVNDDLTGKVTAIRAETGAYEVALVDAHGVITEGSRSNLFFLKGNCVHVSQGHKILKGITMLKTIDLLKHLGLAYMEDDVKKSAVTSYDACFMTSTSNNILPIQSIDDYRFDSSHHPMVEKLVHAFAEIVEKDKDVYKAKYK